MILWHLNQRSHRFGALKRAIPRVSEKVLIEQLRQLKRSALVSRHVQETVPPSVTYSLSKHGQSLKHAIEALSAWGVFPGLAFRLASEPQAVHNCVRFSWHLAPMGSPKAAPIAGGTDFCVLDSDGRLQSATGFLDFAPAPA